MIHHLDHTLTLALAEWILPEQVQISILLWLEQVLLEDTIELVTEHIEVIQLDIANFISFLMRLRFEHIDERQRPRQQSLVKGVLESASEGRHKLTVRDQVVLRDIELLHIHRSVLSVLHLLFGW